MFLQYCKYFVTGSQGLSAINRTERKERREKELQWTEHQEPNEIQKKDVKYLPRRGDFSAKNSRVS
jgi:hypothetical protein